MPHSRRSLLAPSRGLSPKSWRRTPDRVRLGPQVALYLPERPRAQVIRYSQGRAGPPVRPNWESVRTGGGSAPANLTAGGGFVIQNGHNMGTTAAWAVSGSRNKRQIESGGTLTANNIVATRSCQVCNRG